MYIYTFAGLVCWVTMTTVCVKDPVQSSNYYQNLPIFTFLTKQFIDGLESRSNWKGNSYKYGTYENIIQSEHRAIHNMNTRSIRSAIKLTRNKSRNHISKLLK